MSQRNQKSIQGQVTFFRKTEKNYEINKKLFPLLEVGDTGVTSQILAGTP